MEISDYLSRLAEITKNASGAIMKLNDGCAQEEYMTSISILSSQLIDEASEKLKADGMDLDAFKRKTTLCIVKLVLESLSTRGANLDKEQRACLNVAEMLFLALQCEKPDNDIETVVSMMATAVLTSIARQFEDQEKRAEYTCAVGAHILNAASLFHDWQNDERLSSNVLAVLSTEPKLQGATK